MSSLKFSEIAWRANQNLYNKIIQHPFNQQLLDGTLNLDKFSYYIEQDSIYLRDFSKTLALIASKVPTPELICKFIDFAKGAIVAEQEVVHEYFRNTLNSKITDKMSLACVGYTAYLLRCATIESVETAIAAVVPCFWVYNEVGRYIKQQSLPNNIYQRWIDTYASEDFSDGVNSILAIANSYYENANDSMKEAMLKAFESSMMWEYRFWDDSYKFNYFTEI